MSRDVLQPLIDVLRVESPEASGTLFPDPPSAAAWRRAWMATAHPGQSPFGELAAWLLWLDGQSASLLPHLKFHTRACRPIPSDQFWSDTCSLLIARALSQPRTSAHRLIAATMLLSLSRQKLAEVGEAEGARWLKRVMVEGIGVEHTRFIPEILAAAQGLAPGDARAEVGWLWLWFTGKDKLWPARHDGILRRLVGQPVSVHRMFSGLDLLEALPEARLAAIWDRAPTTHPDYQRLRDQPEAVVARLGRVKLDLGLHHQDEATTEVLVSALREPDVSRDLLVEHIDSGGALSPGLARGLRLLAEGSCVGSLIRCLGDSSPQIAIEAVRGLGWLGPEVAQAAVVEAFMLTEGCLPEGTSQERMRRGVVEVLRIWAYSDPDRVRGVIERLCRILSGKSRLKVSLEGIVAREGVSGWFEREEALWRTVLSWQVSNDPHGEVSPDVGLDKLVFEFLGVAARRRAPLGLMDALRLCRDEPLAVVAGVVSLGWIPHGRGWSARPSHAATVWGLFREDFEAFLEHRILYSRVFSTSQYQAHAIESGAGLVGLHLHFLVVGEAQVRAASREHLSARMTPEVLRGLSALLEHRRADVRSEAVRCLGGANDAAALPSLSRALLVEKTARVRGLIEQALASCTPRDDADAHAMGSYDPTDTPDLNRLLGDLREIVHDSTPSAATWVRACDLLQRLDAIESLEIALSGLMGDAERASAFSQDHCARPWNWRSREGLEDVGQPWRKPVWIPFSAFCDPVARSSFLGQWLPRLEEGVRRKKLDPEQGARAFIHYTLEGWAWCERHNLPLDSLTVRVDSGRAGNMARSTKITSLQLVGGFGVQLVRDIAKRASGGSHKTALTLIRVKIPKFHMLRTDPALGRQISQGKLEILRHVAPLTGPEA